MKFIKPFAEITLNDIALVGGKNASLGYMIHKASSLGLRIPDGFAVTTEAYWHFMQSNKLIDPVTHLLQSITITDLESLQAAGQQIRALVYDAHLPQDISSNIITAYKNLSATYKQAWCDIAVRSSATAEDLPQASFAGQQETFLAIRGTDALLDACKKCIASLFTDRAIVYRHEHGIDHMAVALSIGIQKMVRSDLASAGVAFSLDTETGFKNAITISSSYGLGELVVKGTIIPDEFSVHKDRLIHGFRPIIQKRVGSKREKLIYASEEKLEMVAVEQQHSERFSLTDDQILEIARAVVLLEESYSESYKRWTPLDIEWAYDGLDKHLYIVQARPETVHSRAPSTHLTFYTLDTTQTPRILLKGYSIGQKIASGTARLIKDIQHITDFNQGDILVTTMTDPNWLPLLRKAGGIITDQGGRTCHAAIVSRELGIPAIVGTSNATKVITAGQTITLDCSQGSEGFVYQGDVPFKEEHLNITSFRPSSTAIMINIADPHKAFEHSFLPVAGVGLARLEFIIATILKVHPMAVVHPEMLDKETLDKIQKLSAAYDDPRTFYIDVLAQSMGAIAGAFYPRPVIMRLTDFKSNEYRTLLGGTYFEPCEENPMLGFRGAMRYTSKQYAPAFALECAALKKARNTMGFDNIIIMVPFVRNIAEAENTIQELSKHGLRQGHDGLELYMMVEIPSNVLLIDEFARFFDGFSIGSNDLTQLVLGVDRDSSLLAPLFDERDPAVKKMLLMAVQGSRLSQKPIGICGQAPSDFPEIADFLIKSGISSLSLNPDALLNYFAQQDDQHG